MPYGERKVMAVELSQLPDVKYGFRTDVSTTTSTALGHVAAVSNGVFIPGLVLGINSPKPPTAKKFFGANGKRFESSFVDKAKIATARADGWEIKVGKTRLFRSTSFSKVVFVEFKIQDAVAAVGATPAVPAITAKYGWRMPQYQFDKIGLTELTALGVELVAVGQQDVMFGANSVQPQRAIKTYPPVAAQGNAPASGLTNVSTFVATAKINNLPAGWSVT